MISFINKLSLRGLIIFPAATLVILLHNGKLPSFYLIGYLSQEVFLLVLLNLLALYVMLRKESASTLRVGKFHILLFALLCFVAVTNPGDWFSLAVMLLYFLLLLLLRQLFAVQDLIRLLATSAIVAASLSLFEFQTLKFGVNQLFSFLEWLSGYKTSLTYFGVYGQRNLLACLLIIGIFSYLQLIANEERVNWLRLIPISVMSGVLFLTRSRSGLMALGFAGLLLIYFLYKQQLLRKYSRILTFALLAVGTGYLLASLLGATSIDKSIRLSHVSSGDRTSFARANFWVSAVFIGLDHPWSGAGVGGYKRKLGAYTRPVADQLQIGYDTIDQTEWAHNDFLHLFAEHGVLFSVILLVFFLLLIRSVWRTADRQNLFLLPAMAGFMVFMGFGHPLRYHALAFCLLVCLILLLEGVPGRRIIMQGHCKVFVLVSVLFVNVVFVPHLWGSYQLKQFKEWATSQKEISLEDFRRKEQEGLSSGLEKFAYAWQYKHQMYAGLTARIFSARDMPFAAYLLPQVLEYRQENSFASVDYLAAKLAYVLRDYQMAKRLSEQAFYKKPDLDTYFNLVHMSHVMLISKENHRSVVDLTGADLFQEMSDVDMIQQSQLDDSGVAL